MLGKSCSFGFTVRIFRERLSVCVCVCVCVCVSFLVLRVDNGP